ncbi:hypothetical protein PR202_ga08076 [Eleusine coracana subsp. coracana]|uniref:Uncharacterized protein n=1 Tax=Eleusine coracana subsp. coracana TaxID=191504 RepID=A0AAV5C0B6_ELECO|nr:hypothetical protein PR202_ga08076 [Eleusine coracana subsp. coracana]
MHANEKLGVKNPNSNRISPFKSIINDCGLINLGYHEPDYTWINRRHASKAISQRLDTCLANHAWCVLFPNTNVYHLPLLFVIMPLFLLFPSQIPSVGKRVLSLKIGGSENDFQEGSKNVWSQFSHLPFHKRTRQLGHHLFLWSKRNNLPLTVNLIILLSLN